MEHRALGRTGVEVSRVILGCGNFGGIGSEPALFGRGESDEQAFAIMDAAWELGITLFDTADAYGGGRSERAIGRWLASKPPDVRERLVVATKTYNPMGPGEDRGLSRPRILRQVDGSLERLGLERLPLYLIHEWDPETPIEETLETLDELVAAGKLGAVGASNVDSPQLEHALRTSAERGFVRFEWVQNEYSLLVRAPEDGLLDVCGRDGLGFTPFSPLAGGWLTGKYHRGAHPPPDSRMALRPDPYAHLQTERTYRAIDAFVAAARARGAEPATLALAWVLAEPRVTAAIIGPRRPEQLEIVPAALALDLSAAEAAELATLFD